MSDCRGMTDSRLTPRAKAWKDAKFRGHAIEKFLCNHIATDVDGANEFSEQCFGKRRGLPATASAGGARAEWVPSVLGGLSPSKVDMVFEWDKVRYRIDPCARVSHKSSLESQAYLIEPDRFLDGLAARGVTVPIDVRESLRLFIGGEDQDLSVTRFIAGRPFLGELHRRTGLPIDEYQKRISGKTFRMYASTRWISMLDWMDDMRCEIARSVLSTGLSSREEDHATHLWYFDKDGEPDVIFQISEVIEQIEALPTYVNDNNADASTTLELPFGKLQMHQSKMQFRHDFRKIAQIL